MTGTTATPRKLRAQTPPAQRSAREPGRCGGRSLDGDHEPSSPFMEKAPEGLLGNRPSPPRLAGEVGAARRAPPGGAMGQALHAMAFRPPEVVPSAIPRASNVHRPLELAPHGPRDAARLPPALPPLRHHVEQQVRPRQRELLPHEERRRSELQGSQPALHLGERRPRQQLAVRLRNPVAHPRRLRRERHVRRDPRRHDAQRMARPRDHTGWRFRRLREDDRRSENRRGRVEALLLRGGGHARAGKCPLRGVRLLQP